MSAATCSSVSYTHLDVYKRQVVGTIVTGILFYQLLRREKFSQNVCLVTSLLLITSSSLIFQAHRHFMFVNYMPFLLLALLGAHRYFEKGSRWLLCLSVFLMVMTSYYYSVAGIVVVVLYGVCLLYTSSSMPISLLGVLPTLQATPYTSKPFLRRILANIPASPPV